MVLCMKVVILGFGHFVKLAKLTGVTQINISRPSLEPQKIPASIWKAEIQGFQVW